MCHIILALPIFGLVLFWILPLPWAAANYAALTSFSFAVYLLTYQVMKKQPVCGAEAMVGKQAQVIAAAGRELKVKYRNEIWNAQAANEHERGDLVLITEVRQLRLLVE